MLAGEHQGELLERRGPNSRDKYKQCRTLKKLGSLGLVLQCLGFTRIALVCGVGEKYQAYGRRIQSQQIHLE